MIDPALTKLKRLQGGAFIAAGVGAVLSAIALMLGVDSFLHSYLFAFCYWNGFGLGCIGILLLHYLAGGRWGVVLQRVLEAGALTVPYMFILFIPVLIAMPHIFSWARPDGLDTPVLKAKAVYLNTGFFTLRAVIYFIVWSGLAFLLRRGSLREDRGVPHSREGLNALAGPGLCAFVLAGSFAAFDWAMSLEPEWYSSIYGLIFVVGEGLSALVLSACMMRYLKDDEPLKTALTEMDFSDFGNLMLVFVMLSAYVSFSQFIIIWSGNLPDEAAWYLRRGKGGWQWIAACLAAFHFFVPFLVLLFRKAKRNAVALARVALFIALAHSIELYWLIKPAFNEVAMPQLADIAALLLLGGIWVALFVHILKQAPLLPRRAPELGYVSVATVAEEAR